MSWLDDNGDEIFEGVDGSIVMILYNRNYEFLFTSNKYTGWEYVSLCSDGKSIYRRKANNPQAFATKVDDTRAGSFADYDYFNVSFLKQIPIVVAPQLLSYIRDIHLKVFLENIYENKLQYITLRCCLGNQFTQNFLC